MTKDFVVLQTIDALREYDFVHASCFLEEVRMLEFYRAMSLQMAISMIMKAEKLTFAAAKERLKVMLTERSNLGIEKYGTTLDDNKEDINYFRVMSVEECLDNANYISKILAFF